MRRLVASTVVCAILFATLAISTSATARDDVSQFVLPAGSVATLTDTSIPGGDYNGYGVQFADGSTTFLGDTPDTDGLIRFDDRRIGPFPTAVSFRLFISGIYCECTEYSDDADHATVEGTGPYVIHVHLDSGGHPELSTTLTISVPGQNILVNGSFEHGITGSGGWRFRHDVQAGVTTDAGDAPDGTHAAKVTVVTPSASRWLVQLRQEDVTLHAGTTYTVSFWARSPDQHLVNARIQSSASPYRTYAEHDFYVLDDEWRQFLFTYVSPTDADHVFVGFNLANDPGDVFLDDVRVDGGSSVANGGFEDPGGVAPWTFRNQVGATLRRDTAVKSAGAASVRITVPAAGSAAYLAQLRTLVSPLTPGRSYRLRFQVMASKDRVVNVRLQGSDPPYTTIIESNVHATTGWTRVDLIWTPTRQAPNPFLGFNLAQDDGTVWLDDVSLTPVG